MSDKISIRPLTRKEQLEWYIPFLEEQIEAYKAELLSAKTEMLEILKVEKQDEKVKKGGK